MLSARGVSRAGAILPSFHLKQFITFANPVLIHKFLQCEILQCVLHGKTAFSGLTLVTGVEPAYQIAHPGEKDHTNVDRAAWISTFEEALAKTIVHIVLLRQAEQTSQAVGSPKE